MRTDPPARRRAESSNDDRQGGLGGGPRNSEPAALMGATARRLAAGIVAVAAAAAMASPAVAGSILTPPGANPDHRGYEMVSPPDKNFSDIPNTASRIQSTPDGNTLTYISTASFANSPGTADVVQYLASRGAQDWSTRALTPRQQTDEFSFVKNSAFRAFSDDLGKAVFVSGEPRPNPLAPPDVRNLYVRHSDTNVFDVVTTVGSNPAMGLFTEPHYAAASDDFSHVLFESPGTLTRDAPDDGSVKLYESIDGELRLAGVLPNGQPADGGSVAGTGAGAGNLQSANNYTRTTMSADGSRVIFSETNTGQLYSRVDGTTTVQVSRSQRTVADPAGPLPSTFRGASTDGTKIAFTSCEKLTDDSSADSSGCDFGGGSADLYQYDTESGRLTLLSPDSEPADGVGAQVFGVMGQSEDGSHVYFVARGRLTADAGTTAYKLYLWDGDSVSYVGAFSAPDEGNRDVWYQSFQTGLSARVSPNGRYALFASYAAQPGIDNGGARQIYFYDAADSELRCVSCRPGGGASLGDATISQAAPGVPAGKNEYRNRALLDDGSKVFFSTPEPLVQEDFNGKMDAYVYDVATGTASLISTGRSDADSYFAEASADGRDAFFVTRERISARDGDNNNDLYDARVGGGIQEPDPDTSTPCLGDECQGPLASPPGAITSGTTDAFPVEPDDPEPVARSVRVAKPTRSALAAFGRTGRLNVSVRVAGGGSVTATLAGRINGRQATLAKVSKRVAGTSSRSVRLTLRLSRAARGQLTRRGRLRLSLTVALSGAPSKKSTFTVTRKRG